MTIDLQNRGLTIDTPRITRFWQRRMCEASILVASIILVLFFWGLVSGRGSIGSSLFVTEAAALVAAITLIVSIALHMWAPYKYTKYAAALVYALLVASTSMLIVQSEGIHSPFIALWLVAGVFAGLFGWWGIGAALLLANAFIVHAFLYDGATQTDVVIGFLTATMPVIVSYLLWSERSINESAQETAVKTLNKSLERESSKSDAIVQAIGDGVIAVRQTGEIALINPTAQKMVGWIKSDATNLDYKLVLKLETEKGDAITEEHDPIARALNRRQPVRENNIVITTKAGKRVTTSFTVTPLEGEKGGAIAVFRDITKERKEEREQAEFISTASHEMRTPVASIEGYLGLALNPATAQVDEKARDYINKAHESAQHLGHLFQDLLEVSKAEDGRLQNELTAIDVTSFTRDILESLTPQAEEKGLEVVYRPDGTKSTVGSTVIAPVLYAKADKNHLREVIANLIENAIKYTPEGRVQVDASASEKYVRITVEDSGLGIPEEDIPHLFQKFYRVDNSDTREIGGTGLGLYLCRRLVESMNGRILVESSPGKGSQFSIELPRLTHEEASRMLEAQEVKDSDVSSSETLEETPAPVSDTPPPETPTPTPQPPQTPVPMPTLPPELLTPQTPAPTETPTPSPQPTLTPAPIRKNVPLSAIERDPSSYIQRRNNQP